MSRSFDVFQAILEKINSLYYFTLLYCKVNIPNRQISRFFVCVLEYIEGSRKIGNNSDEQKLTKAFKLFDYDKDGEITYKEFSWALHYLAATCYDRDPNINEGFSLNVHKKWALTR